MVEVIMAVLLPSADNSAVSLVSTIVRLASRGNGQSDTPALILIGLVDAMDRSIMVKTRVLQREILLGRVVRVVVMVMIPMLVL